MRRLVVWCDRLHPACGFPPFYADNDAQLFEKIKRAQYEFLKPYWDPISDAAKNFVRRMLVVDPAKRATCEELMNDPWLAEVKAAADSEAAATAGLSEDMSKTKISTAEHRRTPRRSS